MLYALFWFAITYNSETGIWQGLFNVLITLGFHAVTAYFNIYYLIPSLLQRGYYSYYALSILLTITLSTFPILISVYWFNREFIELSGLWNLRYFLITAISVSYTVLTTTAFKLVFDWFKKENESKQLSVLQKETELKYLKTQINPHFLFNSLNNLYSLSLKKSEQTPEVILKLSEILRYLLYEAGEAKVSAGRELNYVRNFVEIEALRFGSRADIQVNIQDEDIDFQIEPMLLIPFVENAFKHGLSRFNSDGFVHINSGLTDSHFFFTITNNVKEVKEVYTDKQGGIGLANVRKRLELLYPGNYHLETEKMNGNFRVNLSIQLR